MTLLIQREQKFFYGLGQILIEEPKSVMKHTTRLGPVLAFWSRSMALFFIFFILFFQSEMVHCVVKNQICSIGLKEHILTIILALDFHFIFIRATFAFKIKQIICRSFCSKKCCITTFFRISDTMFCMGSPVS